MERKAAIPGSPEGTLVFRTSGNAAHLSRRSRAGEAVRLGHGIYVLDSQLPPEDLAQHHLWRIIAHVWPGAVVCDRTALLGARPDQGWVYICHPAPPRVADLTLPGLAVSCRVGPGPLPGDTEFVEGMSLPGPARVLIENVPRPGRPPTGRPPRAAGLDAVGDRIDEMARTGGLQRLRDTFAQLDVVSAHFDPFPVAHVRRLLASALGTHDGKAIDSSRLAARVDGSPYDAHRVDRFEALCESLRSTAPDVRPALGAQERWRWLPFFDAYFSNFIEGTRFPVEEARQIAMEGVEPLDRPADAHDVSATYRIVSDDEEMRQVGATYEKFEALLRKRHGLLMAARADKRPGQFKAKSNYVGAYRFVEPEQLRGTLARGFDIIRGLTDPFQRAVMSMFVVTECHPFDDGNGRIARIMANAELVAERQIRIVIPTVYRDNYLAALSAMSNDAGRGRSLIAMLDFARRWVGAVDWSSWESAISDLERSNAFTESGVAERSGQRLLLPTG